MQDIHKLNGEIKASPALLKALSSVKWRAETKGPRVIFKSDDLAVDEKVYLLFMFGKSKDPDYTIDNARELYGVLAEFDAAEAVAGGVW